MNSQVFAPLDWLDQGQSFINQALLVLVTSTKGSTPQKAAAWMLVTQSHTWGSVGGGRVEDMAIDQARGMLADDSIDQASKEYVLGTALGQCCGGTMDLLFWKLESSDALWLEKARQCIDAGDAVYCTFDNTKHQVTLTDDRCDTTQSIRLVDNRRALALFGAGHVGRRVAMLASCLPIRLSVFDQRLEELNKLPEANNIQVSLVADMVAEISQLAPESAALVMTHMHSLDFLLVKALLERTDIVWIGLIGSRSKAQHFRSILSKQGLNQQLVQRLVCPIGSGFSKDPGIIALNTLTEINAYFEKIQSTTHQGYQREAHQ